MCRAASQAGKPGKKPVQRPKYLPYLLLPMHHQRPPRLHVPIGAAHVPALPHVVLMSPVKPDVQLVVQTEPARYSLQLVGKAVLLAGAVGKVLLHTVAGRRACKRAGGCDAQGGKQVGYSNAVRRAAVNVPQPRWLNQYHVGFEIEVAEHMTT